MGTLNSAPVTALQKKMAAAGAADAPAPPMDGPPPESVEHEWAGDRYDVGDETDPEHARASFTGTNGEVAWIDKDDDGTLRGWVRDADGTVYRYEDHRAWASDVDAAGMTLQHRAEAGTEGQNAATEGGEESDPTDDPFADESDPEDDAEGESAEEDEEDAPEGLDDVQDIDELAAQEDDPEPEDDEEDEDDERNPFGGVEGKSWLVGGVRYAVYPYGAVLTT